MKISKQPVIILLFFIFASFVFSSEKIMVRWAGQLPDHPSAEAPEGVLLNPNFYYWHDVIYTGVKIEFDGKEVESDGRFKNWLGGKKEAVLKAIFPQPYTVKEIAMHMRGKGNVVVEIGSDSDGEEKWEKVYERTDPVDIPMAAANEYWARIKIPEDRTSSKWKIILGSGLSIKGITLWGNGPYVLPEPIGGPVRKKFAIACESIPGADATTFSDHIYWSWQRPLLEDPKFKDFGAVWAQHDKWARLAGAPILPPHSILNKPVNIVMAQNEYEGALLTLTSLKDRIGKPIHDSGIYKEFIPGAQEFKIQLSELKGPTSDRVKLVLRVAATLRTQLWGVVPGPLFSSDNKVSLQHMLKYFTNGKMIADFPHVALPPCGSLIFWLEVQTDKAAPGIYTTTLTAFPSGEGKPASVPVRIEVLPVMLPTPRVWVFTWDGGRPVSTSWPFEPEKSLERTVIDKISRGINTFAGLPMPGTQSYIAKKLKPDAYFHYTYLIPGKWVGAGWSGRVEAFKNLTDAEKEQIKKHIQNVVNQFKKAGVDYGDCFGELWDEPNIADAIEYAAAWVKDVDPKVNIYVNPAFPDLEHFKRMSKVADCFVPFWGNWFKTPEKQWQKEIRPNRINAMYAVQGSNRSELHEELVGHYRILPWQAFKLGLNGWGFYSYYAPRGDPYTDYEPEGSETDYCVVYPGPYGPVPTRQAEAFRDGWEDYRLLILLKESKKNEAKKVLNEALSKIPMGREPLTATGIEPSVDFEQIRIKLLRAAARLMKQ